MLRALPFAIIAAISVSRMVLGPGVGGCCPAAVATAGAAAVGGCGPPWPQVRERWRYSRCSRAAYSRLPLTGWQGSRSWPWPVSRWPVRWPQARRRRDRELRRSG